ncbi:ABC transporter substrate-binding protein [candidate division KSB1 bacterium]
MTSIRNLKIRKFIDARGKEVLLPPRPERIVSFICSITETLFEIGAGERVIGRTNYCIKPAPVIEEVQKIGGPKNPDIDLILSLKPDLLIANVEENEKKDIDILERSGVPVFVTYPKTITDSIELIKTLGMITDTEAEAGELYNKAINIAEEIKQKTESSANPPSIVYLIWRKPFMTINSDTYINNLIEFCGVLNVFADRNERYPEISLEDIMQSRPEIIFFPSEPYPYKKIHTEEFMHLSDIPAVRNNRLLLVDGEMFSWYGYRMIHGLKYIYSILNEQ